MEDRDRTTDTTAGARAPVRPEGFTQAQVDAIVASRLARQREQSVDFAALGYEDRASAEAALKFAKEHAGSEDERLAAERDARAKAEEALTKERATSRERALRAEARAQAASLGIPAGSIAYALKLADLSEVAVSEEGEPDGTAVRAAMERLLMDLPALRGTMGSGGANPPQKGIRDPFEEGFGI